MTGPSAAAPPDRPIDWRQVRLVISLRWRILFNQWSTRPGMAALSVIVIAAFGMMFALAGVALMTLIPHLRQGESGGPDLAAAAVHQTFLFVFLLMTVTPVMGLRGNEFLDVTKLFVFPVSHRTVFAATLGGLMTSLSVVFFYLPMAGAVIGYGGTTGEILAGLAIAALLLVAAVATGQFLLVTFLATLKSRKWRDISSVVFPLFAGGIWATFSIMSRGQASDGAVAGVVRWFARWVDWTMPLPSWWAGHAVTGTGWVRFLPVAALLALVVWLIRASATMQERAYYGETGGGEAATQAVGRRGVFLRIAGKLRDPLGALAEKEISLFFREPAVRSMLIGQSIYPLMWVGIGVMKLMRQDPATLARFAPLAGLVAYPLLMMEFGLVINQLGLEGGGAVHAMLLPVPRRTLLLGKALAYLLVLGTFNAAAAVIATVLAWGLTHAGAWHECAAYSLLGALEGYCVIAVGIGIGSVISVIAPMRVAVRDRRALRQQTSGKDGCLRSLLTFAGLFAIAMLAAPVGLCFHLPTIARIAGWTQVPGWLPLVTVPLAVLGGGVAIAVGTWFGGSLLESRDEDVISRLAKADE